MWEGLLTEVKAPWSTHELKSVHQLGPAEGLRSSCGRAGEGEEAEGQVEEMGGRHGVHLYLPERKEQGVRNPGGFGTGGR